MQHLEDMIDKLQTYHLQVENNIHTSCIQRQNLGSMGEDNFNACRIMEVLINEMMKESFRVQTIINMLNNNQHQGLDFAYQLMDELVVENEEIKVKTVDYSTFH